MQKSLIREVFAIIERNENAALCLITGTKGSTPLKAGAKMIVWEDGRISGTVGGGAFEKKVIEDALEVIAGKRAGQYEHHLTRDHEMCCGGTVWVYIEPIELPWRLYIFGAGHVGKELAYYASDLDFEVTVIDDRKNIFKKWDNPCLNLINKDPLEVIPSLRWCSRSFAVIMTYSHPLDRSILAECIKLPTGFLGMIGSMRKVEVTKKIFIQKSIASVEELSRVDMPIGININAHTPKEIAISILSRLIMERNKKENDKNSPQEKATLSENEIHELLAGMPKCG